MRRSLIRLLTLAVFAALPTAVGCGSGNKTEIPKTFAPPQTTEPQSEGGPKGKKAIPKGGDNIDK